jgi:hypothetical protein
VKEAPAAAVTTAELPIVHHYFLGVPRYLRHPNRETDRAHNRRATASRILENALESRSV